jgi:hypothetical protein
MQLLDFALLRARRFAEAAVIGQEANEAKAVNSAFICGSLHLD